MVDAKREFVKVPGTEIKKMANRIGELFDAGNFPAGIVPAISMVALAGSFLLREGMPQERIRELFVSVVDQALLEGICGPDGDPGFLAPGPMTVN